MELILRVLKWSVLAGAATALVTALKPLLDRRFTPRWRYWLWLALAAALLLSPLPLDSLLPALPEPAVTVTAPEIRVPAPAASRPAPEVPVIPVIPNDPVKPDHPATPVVPVTPDIPAASDTPVTPGNPTGSGMPATPGTPPTGTAGRRTVALSTLLTAVWLLGAAAFALWYMAGTVLLERRLRRWSVPAGGAIDALCRELSGELGLSKAPKTGVSRGLTSPLVTGLWRPRLWLPDRTWEGRELELVLRHELTHIKRRDLGYKALMLAANALHWFDPLIWLMRREAGETVELLCDAQALRDADQDTRRAYCEALLANIRRVRSAALTTYFYSGKSSVKARFKNLLSGRKRRFGWAALAFCVLALTVTACAVGVGASTAIAPEEFDGTYTANCFKYVFLRDENGERIQDKAVLINSLDQLKKLRRDNGVEPLDEGYSIINGELTERLDTYTKDYFRENVLAVLIREMGSGSFELSVKGVTLDGDAVAVTVSSYNPTAPTQTMDLCQWCVLVECPRVEGITAVQCTFEAEDQQGDGAPDAVADALSAAGNGFAARVAAALEERVGARVQAVYPQDFYQMAELAYNGSLYRVYDWQYSLTVTEPVYPYDSVRFTLDSGETICLRRSAWSAYSEELPSAFAVRINEDLTGAPEILETLTAAGVAAHRRDWTGYLSELSGKTAPHEPTTADRAELIGRQLVWGEFGGVVKVKEGEEVSSFVLSEEELAGVQAALTGLHWMPSTVSSRSWKNDDMWILAESGDGRYAVRLGLAYGPVELTAEGTYALFELPEAEYAGLWRELFSAAQRATEDAVFSGVSADRSLSTDEAAEAMGEGIAAAIRALPSWVAWKPLDVQFTGASVSDAYRGEPESFRAGVNIALKFTSDDPADPGRSFWEAGSGLPDEPISGGAPDGYYAWDREICVCRDKAGQWVLTGMNAGGSTVSVPGWMYASDVESSFERASVEELLRLYTLSGGDLHEYIVMLLCRKTPRELENIGSALAALSPEALQELSGQVKGYIQWNGGVPTTSQSLLYDALRALTEK